MRPGLSEYHAAIGERWRRGTRRGIAVGQAPVTELVNLGVEIRTDPRHLTLGDPGVDAQGLDQVVDLARGDTVQVGLHHYREQCLIDATAAFEQAGKNEPARSFGIRNSRSPAVVDRMRVQFPLR